MSFRPTLLALCFLTSGLFADWTNWRGPNFNLATDDQDFPSTFSTTENVLWTAKLPGEGASTPAIWKDTIYITSLEDGMNTLLALDLTGQAKWTAQAGVGEEGKHRKGTGANPSPVVDESGIYVYYKSATLAKFDHSGNELWRRELQKEYSPIGHWWDLGTSPVVEDGKVIVAVMQVSERRRTGESCESFVVAFDKDTGKEVWKVDRVTDANTESKDAYTTPLVATLDGQKQLVVWGADQLTSHSLKDGSTLWVCKNFNPTNHPNWRTITSHAIAGEVAVVPYGRGEAVAGIRMGGKGDITNTSRLWEIKRIGPDVPTPAIYGEVVIILNDRDTLTAVEIESGKIRWQEKLPRTAGKFYASPVIAGDRLICSRDDGTVFVCGLNKDGMEVLAENSMGSAVIATPVPHNDRLYIRTSDSRLFCIGKDAPTVGVGAKPIEGAELMLDGSRASLDANWEYWEGPRFSSQMPIKWLDVEDPVDGGPAISANDPAAAGGLYGAADIVTKKKYGDKRVHVEFLIKTEGGNSGVYLQNRYEIQILDGDQSKHGMAAVINETESPYFAYHGLGLWNAYDIQFRAARFANGEMTEKPMVTVYFNGHKVHTNVIINKVWGGPNSGLDGGNANGFGITNTPGGLKLQAEGHDVRYRNVWIKEMNFEEPDTDF